MIKNVTRSDLGAYECVAKNSLGETRGMIRVYESAKVVTDRSITQHNDSDLSSKRWIQKYAAAKSASHRE